MPNLIAAWYFEDADIGDTDTCADDKGLFDLAYSTTGADLTRGSLQYLTGAGPGLVFDDAISAQATANSVPASLQPQVDIALEFIVRTPSSLSNQRLYSQYQDANNRILIWFTGTELDCRISAGGNNVGSLTSGANLAPDTEYHIVVSIPAGATSNADTRVFINKAEQTVGTASTHLDTTGYLTIGAENDGGGSSFGGTIAFAGQWDGELSQADVDERFESLSHLGFSLNALAQRSYNMPFYKNTASQKIPVYAIDTATLQPKTGDAANITAQLSIDGGTSAATNDTNPTELDAADHPGVYLFDMTQAETNGDLIALTAVSSTSNVFLLPVLFYTEPVQREVDAASLRTATGQASANLDTQFTTVLATLTAMNSAIPTQAALEARDGILDRVLSGNHDDAGTPGAFLQLLDAAITTRLASGSYSAPLDAAGVRTALGLAAADLDTQLDALPAAARDAVLDRALSGNHDTAGTPGALIQNILDAAGVRTAVGLAAANLDTQLSAIATATGVDITLAGTVNDAAATTTSFTAAGLTLDASAYAGQFIVFTSGNLEAVAREIKNTSAGTTIELKTALPEAPADTTPFIIGGKA